MTMMPSEDLINLRFYLSGPLPCPYLPAQVERKLFTYLRSDNGKNAEINGALCRAGFRRSQDIVYRPACEACNACIPVRVPVGAFLLTRSLRRVLARNDDLSWEQLPLQTSADLFSLFCAYQKARHGDSDMVHMAEEDFAAMLCEGQADTRLYGLRGADGVLKGCILADRVGDGLSAVYSFFTPDEPHRSLGTMLILSLIGEARNQGLPFVYLGYWIAAARKMSYKSRFQPMQVLNRDGWTWLEN
ncbi:MAG: arginyltransferase [Bdellovibrionales bacterium]